MCPINRVRLKVRHDFSTGQLINSADYNSNMTKHGINNVAAKNVEIVKCESHKMEMSQNEECFNLKGVQKFNFLL
jgi:hypothetical protein